MSKLKLKINVNLPHLLCIVVSAALHGEFERFGGFCVDCYYTLLTDLNFPYICRCFVIGKLGGRHYGTRGIS